MNSDAYPVIATLTPRPVLLTRGGTTVYNGGFGSGLARHPTDSTRFYMLTDRGPNYRDAGGGSQDLPDPAYAPRIGLFHLQDSVLTLEKTIELRDVSGSSADRDSQSRRPWRHRRSSPRQHGERARRTIPRASIPRTWRHGDGSFWVADEYGPSLLHLTPSGAPRERINPFSGARSLPAVFSTGSPTAASRDWPSPLTSVNLVAVFETPLDNPKAAGRASRSPASSLFDLATGQTRQFAYVLEKVGSPTTAWPRSRTPSFSILERDDKFPGRQCRSIDLQAGLSDRSLPGHRSQ